MVKGTYGQATLETDETQPETKEETPSEPTLERDSLFHVLQTSRRRAVLQYLQGHLEDEGGDYESVSPVPIGDLTEWIAAREHDITVEELRSSQRQRVYISLYQTHLPKLDELEIIHYDDDRGLVRPTPVIREFDPYLGSPQPSRSPRPPQLPWVAACGLLTVSGATLLALTASGLFSMSPFTAGGLIVATLGILTAAQTYNLTWE
ncbi:hypothetical protein ACLI4U_03900 [Natrialbaceae archaeon A-CW2]